MNPLAAVSLLLVAAGGTAVVLTRDPVRQAIVLSFYGLLLTLLFLVLQAPDVALSELAVGAAALPLILVASLLESPASKTMNDQLRKLLFFLAGGVVSRVVCVGVRRLAALSATTRASTASWSIRLAFPSGT